MDELKAKGNEAFKAGKHEEAIKHFTDAIAVAPENHVLYSNRSAAHASLQHWDEAVADADKTIALKTDWPKGYGRKGAALFGSGDLPGALEAYKKGLELDPQNKMLIDGMAAAENKLRSFMSSQQAPDPKILQLIQKFCEPNVEAKLRANPNSAELMEQPDFVEKLKAIQANPMSLQSALGDPRIMTALSVLIQEDQTPEERQEMRQRQFEEQERRAEQQRKRDEGNRKRKREQEEAEKKAAEEEAYNAMSDDQKEALKEKELGTEAYKSKDFDTALQHYEKAARLDPANVIFPLNIGAVHFQRKDYDKCIEVCTIAAEKGLSERADYKLIAKAFARAGKSYFKKGELTESMNMYNKAVANHRAADIVKQKQAVEKALKDQERLAYLNPEKAEEARLLGNDLFRKGDFPGSIKQYTEAIKRNPEDHKLYSNRAAAYMKLAEWRAALKDCDVCLEKEPTFVKGMMRKGNVLIALKEHQKALLVFQSVLELEPENAEAKQAISKAIYAENTLSGEERRKRAATDPEVLAILQDPVMQQILEQMQSDPGAVQAHLQNPEIAAKIQILVSAGIISMGR